MLRCVFCLEELYCETSINLDYCPAEHSKFYTEQLVIGEIYRIPKTILFPEEWDEFPQIVQIIVDVLKHQLFQKC